MDWLLIPTILQKIEQSPLQNIPNFLSHILDGQTEYGAPVAAIKSPQGTHLILNSLLHVCWSMVMEWVISMSEDMLRQELIQALDVWSGLHFNTSHACSADLMG